MAPLTDMDILSRAYNWENEPKRRKFNLGWSFYHIGVSKEDMERLLQSGLVEVVFKTHNSRDNGYKLTEKGRGLVSTVALAHAQTKIQAGIVLEAMDMIVGFEDIKERLSKAIEARDRRHYLLEGPPACGKSAIMDAIRNVVPTAELCFGSSTTAAGLSNLLFERQPTVLLFDEFDKPKSGVYSIMLGLAESGEIRQVKADIQGTRGLVLNCQIIAACNRTDKMTPEILSRFNQHIKLDPYDRDTFIKVCEVYLSRVEGCPPEIGAMIGKQVFDYKLGDFRRARAVWKEMNEATETEMKKAIDFMIKYSPERHQKQAPAGARLC